jgi:hypothetical protein
MGGPVSRMLGWAEEKRGGPKRLESPKGAGQASNSSGRDCYRTCVFRSDSACLISETVGDSTVCSGGDSSPCPDTWTLVSGPGEAFCQRRVKMSHSWRMKCPTRPLSQRLGGMET